MEDSARGIRIINGINPALRNESVDAWTCFVHCGAAICLASLPLILLT